MNIEEIKNRINPIVSQYPVTYVGLFGSYSKNTQTQESDVDLVINYTKPFSYFDLVKLQEELQIALGRSVDVVTEPSLSPFIKDEIIRDIQIIYGQR